MAVQLSVRLLFLSGDEEGDGGDVGCFFGVVWMSFGLCGCAVGLCGLSLYLRVVWRSMRWFWLSLRLILALWWGGCFVRCGECGEKGGDGVVFRWRFCVFRGILRGVFWSFWVGCAVVCVFVLNG